MSTLTQAASAAPSRLRFVALLMLAVYPLVTTILLVVMPLTEGWPLWGRTLIVTPLMVVAMVYIVIPSIHRHFGGFLRGR